MTCVVFIKKCHQVQQQVESAIDRLLSCYALRTIPAVEKEKYSVLGIYSLLSLRFNLVLCVGVCVSPYLSAIATAVFFSLSLLD